MRAVSNRTAAILAAAAFTGLSVSAASAEVIATFGYTELNGSYNNLDVDSNGDPLYRATAVDTGSLQTRGDVTRLIPTGGTATFDTGFSSGGTGANYVAAISVIGFGSSRGGVGSVTITDVDGDTLSMAVNGTWTPGPGTTGIIYFNGLISNVLFASNGNGIGDGTFDGTSGTGFSTADLTGVYSGALVQLSTRPGVGFFQGNFSNVSTLVTANIVPAPGTVALAGIAGLVGLRRRR
jgi:hypothetical protein